MLKDWKDEGHRSFLCSAVAKVGKSKVLYLSSFSQYGVSPCSFQIDAAGPHATRVLLARTLDFKFTIWSVFFLHFKRWKGVGEDGQAEVLTTSIPSSP